MAYQISLCLPPAHWCSFLSLSLHPGPSPPLLDVRCEECVSLASLSCPQCDGHYCTKCFETVHMSSNSMRRHKPVPLSQLNSGPTHCPSHLSNPMDYFCTEDSQCCCSECCITGGHKGHQVVSLSEAVRSSVHAGGIPFLLC